MLPLPSTELKERPRNISEDIDRWTDGWIDGLVGGWKDASMVRWIDGWMDGRTDRGIISIFFFV